jgi:uncharacterized tellurite resistance protein B-like protein
MRLSLNYKIVEKKVKDNIKENNYSDNELYKINHYASKIKRIFDVKTIMQFMIEMYFKVKS